MDTTWIVSANGGRARIFSETGRTAPLQEVKDMVNTPARIPTSDELTDRLGPLAAGDSAHGTGAALPTSQYQPEQTPDEREAEVFAKDVCGFLLKARQEGQFQKLKLVASPKFLGVLRVQLDANLKPLVTAEIDKDYTHSNGQQLREQLLAQQSKAS